MDQPLIITDLDNTLYNFVDYFGPIIRAMVHVISKETGVDENIIIDDFRRVYNNQGCIEYQYLVQELEIFSSASEVEKAKMIQLVKRVYVAVARRHLCAYDGVRNTLSWSVNSGARIICLSNAPIYLAIQRLKQLRLIHFFDGVAGRMSDVKLDYSRFMIWQLRTEQLKPNIDGYLCIINHFGTEPRNTFIVGDSLKNDIEPALKIGAQAIWAIYGNNCELENLETLKRISTRNESDQESEPKIQNIERVTSINSFSDIRSIIESPLNFQLALPGF